MNIVMITNLTMTRTKTKANLVKTIKVRLKFKLNKEVQREETHFSKISQIPNFNFMEAMKDIKKNQIHLRTIL